MEALRQQWNSKKQLILGIVIGMLVGPLVSGMIGWQVSSAFLQRSVHAAVVKQQVAFCEMRAKAAVKNLDKLEYSARYDVAKAWATMPGQAEADSEVVSGCTNGLSGV